MVGRPHSGLEPEVINKQNQADARARYKEEGSKEVRFMATPHALRIFEGYMSSTGITKKRQAFSSFAIQFEVQRDELQKFRQMGLWQRLRWALNGGKPRL